MHSPDLIIPDLQGEAWRLIRDTAQDGATDMAVDEVILKQIAAGSQPTLRLYRWSVPTLSLGFSQPLTDAAQDRISDRGWGLVRRLTGGRAILHADELTYSVAVRLDHPLAQGSIVESYRRISSALLIALEQIGLAASADRHDKPSGAQNPICFEVPSNYEIAVGGRKLVGSAQVRKYGALLQHGTLPLTGDLSRIVDALVYPDETARDQAREQVHTRALTLELALNGVLVGWDQVADSFEYGFATRFNMNLQPAQLSETEQSDATQLATDKYADPAWLEHRTLTL